jgi:hypothetical protein
VVEHDCHLPSGLVLTPCLSSGPPGSVRRNRRSRELEAVAASHKRAFGPDHAHGRKIAANLRRLGPDGSS